MDKSAIALAAFVVLWIGSMAYLIGSQTAKVNECEAHKGILLDRVGSENDLCFVPDSECSDD